MPAKVKILVEGSTNADTVAETGEERTRPTISLVRDGGVVMVVDPGTLESQQILVDALKSEGLNVEDVNIVCITHSHVEHYRNVGMFQKAKTLEFYGLWKKESVEDWPEQFSPHIRVLKTPGHDYTGITLFVTTDKGIVAICGDVFWRENYPKEAGDDAFASNVAELEKSRETILGTADWIVPGHAGIFKVKKKPIGGATNGVAGAKKKKKKVVVFCKKCKRAFDDPHDSCICRPWLCYRCCECEMDCNTCSCSHRKK